MPLHGTTRQGTAQSDFLFFRFLQIFLDFFRSFRIFLKYFYAPASLLVALQVKSLKEESKEDTVFNYGLFIQ